MVYISRSRQNGVPPQGICIQNGHKKVDHVTSRLTPLSPLYQRPHWRQGQEASGETIRDEQLLFPPPSPTLKVITTSILDSFSLPQKKLDLSFFS